MRVKRGNRSVGNLTGKFFHSVASDRTTIEWQGEFLDLVAPGMYRLQTFDWIIGQSSDQLLVPVADMRYWRIYDSAEDMNRAYADYSRKMDRADKIKEVENVLRASS